ncbi:MAG: DUF4382 domain-containing protein [Betaproteobacteria bacterium]|nr:DUF4382 domain-containing protein [Betaproteobacteria bacterium]
MNRASAIHVSPRLLTPLAASLVLALSACGGGGGGGTPTGNANFALTDAPVCNGLQSVVVTVDAVELIGASGTYTLTLPQPVQIDLTTLTNGTSLPLGDIRVPAGTYQQLRLMLAANTGNSQPLANYVVPAGSTTPQALTTPSAQQSGYKINGQFTVAANGQVNLTVDFNACRSVVVAGNSGKYLLKPVLNLSDDDESGSISGYVPAADAGAVVMAEDAQGHVLKTTVAAVASGTSGAAAFTLSPLPASSTGYDVVIAPPVPTTQVSPSPDFAPEVVLGVPVAVGQSTGLGTAASPLPMLASTQDAYFSGTINLPEPADTLVVAQEALNSTTTISVAQTNGVETSSPTTQDYAMDLSVSAPNVATYAPTGLAFVQGAAPSITIRAFASDGASGTAAPDGSITLAGDTDDTFDMDH